MLKRGNFVRVTKGYVSTHKGGLAVVVGDELKVLGIYMNMVELAGPGWDGGGVLMPHAWAEEHVTKIREKGRFSKQPYGRTS